MIQTGLNRLIELFKNDIDHIEYDVDGATQIQNTYTATQTEDELEIEFLVGDMLTGVIDNINIIGTTTTYDTKVKTFNKVTVDGQKVIIPYKIEVKVV